MRKRKRSAEPQPSCSYWGEGSASGARFSESETEVEEQEEEEEEQEGEEEDEERDYNELKQKCLEIPSSASYKAKGERKKALKEKMEDVMSAQTPDEIKSMYVVKVDNLRKEALALENKREHHIATNKDFWSIVVKSLPGVKKRDFTQVRELKVKGRKIVSCPMPFCIGKVKDMTRHLCQVHGVVSAVEQRNLMKKTGVTTPKADSTPRRKSLHRCSVCDNVLSRIDSHLVSKHGLKRGTVRFKELLSASMLTKGDQEEEPLDAQDPDLGKKLFKVFLERYKRCLQNTSALSHNSIELSVRIISDVIKYSFKVQKDSFQEKALINVFLNLGNDESFLKRRAGTLSGSYCCNIIFTCIRVLEYLKYQYEELPRAQEADYALKNLLKRYQKVEKKERAASRERKAGNVLSSDEIKNISRSSSVKLCLKAGVVSRSVNTRMLRRSTPLLRRSIKILLSGRNSQLAGHSYETARRYYAIYDTRDQARNDVSKLEEYRESGIPITPFSQEAEAETETELEMAADEEGIMPELTDEQMEEGNRDEAAAPERSLEVDSSEAMEETFVAPLPPPAIRQDGSSSSFTHEKFGVLALADTSSPSPNTTTATKNTPLSTGKQNNHKTTLTLPGRRTEVEKATQLESGPHPCPCLGPLAACPGPSPGLCWVLEWVLRGWVKAWVQTWVQVWVWVSSGAVLLVYPAPAPAALVQSPPPHPRSVQGQC
ncbi:hypothetical protein O3P69_012648 [Scylla paramamosain]|uniref:Uncharacterized protein n=1 Tax=Scylla paramamosain TaxID=85552 RepID=A0AAW0SD82_SCYPA